MALIVKKFGGTSVSTAQRRQQVLAKIIAEKKAGHDVVVVASAMGRRGDPYATDTFLDMLKEISPQPAKRTKDLLAACGEVITSCVMAEELVSWGYAAVPLTGLQAGIRTDENFTNGIVLSVDPSRLQAVLATGAIAVVTGFQGYSQAADLVTLGRGGSDTTAIALGGALGADVVEIFTDVPGIAYTDPRLVPSAPFLSAIAFDPMYILAKTGARVVHHRAIETAIKFQRPFWVKSTFSDDPGTLVGQAGEAPGGLYGIALLKDMMLGWRERDPAQEMRPYACNEWFYRRHPQRVAVVVEPEDQAQLPRDCRFREVSVITLQWAADSGITPEMVARALDIHHIPREGYFVVPGGGAWAVAPERAKEAVLALYRAPFSQR